MTAKKAPDKATKKPRKKVAASDSSAAKAKRVATPVPDSPSSEPGAIDLGLLPDLIGYHLHRAEIASYRLFVNAFHHPKYTPKQFSVLMLAYSNPGISQISIGNALGMDRATTMAVIDKMQSRKLLTRERSTQDRRKQEVVLTEKGLELTRRLMVFVKEHETRLAARLSADEAATLGRLLFKVREALES